MNPGPILGLEGVEARGGTRSTAQLQSFAEAQLHNERRHFERPTGLLDLVVTEPGQYPKLLRQIREHRRFLGRVPRGRRPGGLTKPGVRRPPYRRGWCPVDVIDVMKEAHRSMADDGLSRDHTTKKIALVAHDNIKGDLLDWARSNRPLLLQHELYATGTTGTLLEQDLTVRVHKLQSGPLGGDQQVGARITEGEIDLLIFFWDPLQAHPHDPDVRALLRVAVLWNIPVACNRASADYMISSPLLSGAYQRRRPQHEADSE